MLGLQAALLAPETEQMNIWGMFTQKEYVSVHRPKIVVRVYLCSAESSFIQSFVVVRVNSFSFPSDDAHLEHHLTDY